MSFVKVFFFFFSFLDTIRSFAFCGRGLNRPKCITEACFEIWFSLTALIGWCGRLSVHDSSFSVYGATLRLELPDGDSPHSY